MSEQQAKSHYAFVQWQIRTSQGCGCTRCVTFYSIEFFVVGTYDEPHPGCDCCKCRARKEQERDEQERDD